MPEHRIALSFAVGLVIATGQIVAAQPTQSVPKTQSIQAPEPRQLKPRTLPENKGEVVSVLRSQDRPNAASQPIELRLLDRAGKTIAQVRVEFPKGQQLEVGANRMIEVAANQGSPKRWRLEGDIVIKTLRGNVSTTLLKMEGPDAIVEYTTPVDSARAATITAAPMNP
ncbi:MAG: hypothetical protein V4671_13005 [Armatimonadota bacterium]